MFDFFYFNPSMLWSSILEVSLPTTRATNANKSDRPAFLENIGWALFEIITCLIP